MSIYVLKGLSPWVVQRISSVLVALFMIYAFICAYTATDISYEAWTAWLFSPLNTILVGLFAVSVLLHAWVGIRDVVLDYIHYFVLRIVLLTGIAGVLVASGLWVVKILLLTTK